MRVAICGGADLARAAAVLGLEVDSERPAAALVDLRGGAGLVVAARLPATLPRVVIADASARAVLRALGRIDECVVDSCDPAVIGPALRRALPAVERGTTGLVLVTSARGGVGRTLLVTNLARRLARRCAVLLVDLTGSGAAGWWLGTGTRSWSELESLSAELTASHLSLLVATDGAAPVLGGAPVAPSVGLAVAATRAATSYAGLVLIDAPVLADERTRALAAFADRVIVVTYDDPATVGVLNAAELPAEAWLIASQSTAGAVAGREVFRALPRDERAVAAALAARGAVGGALGRAYDGLADVLAVDASP